MNDIILGRIKGQYLAPIKRKCPFSTLINKGGFYGLRRRIFGSKVGNKSAPPLIFQLSVSSSFLSPLHVQPPQPSPTPWSKATQPCLLTHPFIGDRNHRCQSFLLPFQRILLLPAPKNPTITLALLWATNLSTVLNHTNDNSHDPWVRWAPSSLSSSFFFFAPQPLSPVCITIIRSTCKGE